MKRASICFLLTFVSVSFAQADRVPDDLLMTSFSGSEITPSPACLCVGEDGSVYVGVDLNGSLGKGPGKGRIVRLVDTDKDGVADSHSVFAEVDNPRGLIANGSTLWVLHTSFDKDGVSTGMDLVRFRDENSDGVADGAPEPLVRGICSATAINNRGTDHSTNGIQMGIDGWIYIAVGDFGFADAVGADGTKLTLLGGGIVRVRPNGSEMELYTSGMRNIYDVAIDPYMNLFTRGNTNDGGGWNVRFSHHIQSGEFGYPRLFINFAEEIIPALEDLGGGSGVGALFLDEPSWPGKYNSQPLMADWGRQAVFLHRLAEDGPTFRQLAEEFVQISQVSDLDVDPSGKMFLSAWNGAGFQGSEEKGYVVRVVPKGWSYKPAPSFSETDLPGLVELIVSDSAKTRFHAQQTLLSTPNGVEAKTGLLEKAGDTEIDLGARVAALYTYSQLEPDPAAILNCASLPGMREFALRAATDRLSRLKEADLPLEPFVQALNDGSPREQAAAAVALGRIGSPDAAASLLAVDYSKPAPEGKATSTQLDTIKGNRASDVKLSVTPGEKLYFSLAETNTVEQSSRLDFVNSEFKLADGSGISLAALRPIVGEVTVQKVGGGESSGNGGKKKKKPKVDGLIVTVSAPAKIIYEVPAKAILFQSKVMYSGAGPKDGSVDFFASTIDPEMSGAGIAVTPRHATPNPDVILPHLAMNALVRIGSAEDYLDAIGTSSEDLALWALSSLHRIDVVEGLVSRLKETSEPSRRQKLLTTLSRLYQEEASYDGSWWWTTRPDTRGPYYKPVTWAGSGLIAETMKAELEIADDAGKAFLAGLNDRMRMGLTELWSLILEEDEVSMPTVDLEKIRSKEGAIGSTPIEDVILSLATIKGNPEEGEKLFAQQGCVACHALAPGGPALGPYMGQIGSIMKKDQIAVAILRPEDTISQGFQTAQIVMKDGTVHTGFVTESNSDEVTLRDMAGQVTRLRASDVEKEEHLPVSMMPPGLANALSLEQFASLVEFLASKKG